jgi:hypothetical protein
MTTFRFDDAFGLVFHLVLVVVLVGYLRGALRTGSAVGPAWDFLRESEPVRYWLWLALIAAWAVGAAGTSVAMLYELI